jgi:serine/threonine protein phosphatase PrpC
MQAKIQYPLPEVIKRDLSYELISFLDQRDYSLEKNVTPLLLQELSLAKKQFNTYENSLFPASQHLERPISVQLDTHLAIATTQGLRDSQEDAHLVFTINDLKVSALFDGHLGSKCSHYCQTHYEDFFNSRLSDPELNALPEEDFLYNVLTLSLVDLSRSFPLKEPGCTANIALIQDSSLFVANVGDSRALFVTKNEITGLSVDARARDERFFIDIVARGGFVTKNYTVAHPLSPWTIAPAQSIGDHHLKGVMNPRPKIALYKIEEKGVLIQACDGLFDVASTAQVGKRVQEFFEASPEEIAKRLTQDALNSGSGDNITVLVRKV